MARWDRSLWILRGRKQDARLVVSEAPVGGTAHTEAGIVRLVFRLSGEEGKSCIWIAGYLNRLGVPPSYARDGRQILRGKRKQATAGLWTTGRIRNLIVSTTYRGLHQYGKRSSRKRAPIDRQVPAIVSEKLWNRAQETLKRNLLFSKRNACRKYLLRGLMRCGLCGLTYIGTAYRVAAGLRVYYVCNGKGSYRGIYGRKGKPCPSKAIQGTIEDLVWRDIEGFLRNPGDVLAQLRGCMEGEQDRGGQAQRETAELQGILDGKGLERDRVLALFRRGRIDEATLDQQLAEIETEGQAIQERLIALERELSEAGVREVQLDSAETFLRELNRRLDEPLTWEAKRRLVELLVEGVRVDTIERRGQKDARATVTYRFAAAGAATDGDWQVQDISESLVPHAAHKATAR